jgi:hypothetical protein
VCREMLDHARVIVGLRQHQRTLELGDERLGGVPDVQQSPVTLGHRVVNAGRSAAAPQAVGWNRTRDGR